MDCTVLTSETSLTPVQRKRPMGTCGDSMRASWEHGVETPWQELPAQSKQGLPLWASLRSVACFLLCNLSITSHIPVTFRNHRICKLAEKARRLGIRLFPQIRRCLGHKCGRASPLAPASPPGC